MDERFWGEMLGVLKDIGSYLEKQDATQERANIDVPPRMQENPKPIKGGEMPAGFRPADKVAKEYVPFDEARDRNAGELDGNEQTFLKEDELEEEELEDEVDEEQNRYQDDEEEEMEDDVEEDLEEDEEDEELDEEEDEELDELKSILKDIKSALVKQSNGNSANVVKAEIKKSLPGIVKGETDKMLRKMGFIPTRGDIKRIDVEKSYGLDDTEETLGSKDIKKSKSNEAVMQDALDNMSKKSWTELGQLRENTDGFNAFGR